MYKRYLILNYEYICVYSLDGPYKSLSWSLKGDSMLHFIDSFSRIVLMSEQEEKTSEKASVQS